MSTDTALQAEVVDPPNLAELAETINREHEFLAEAAVDMVSHAIALGNALLAARVLTRRGEWRSWLAANTYLSEKKARKFMRLADYQEIVSGASNVSEALHLAAGQPARSQKPSWIPEARRMRSAGVRWNRIAEVLDVSPSTVRFHIDQKTRHQVLSRLERRRQADAIKAAEQNAREQRERERVVRAYGGGVSEAYSLMRRALQCLDRLSTDGSTPEIRARSNAAMALMHKAEDEIVDAVKMSVTDA